MSCELIKSEISEGNEFSSKFFTRSAECLLKKIEDSDFIGNTTKFDY